MINCEHVAWGGGGSVPLMTTHIDKSQVDLDTMKHRSEGGHENCESSDTPMSSSEDLSISGVGLEICNKLG